MKIFGRRFEGISFYLIHAESNEWGIVMKQMLMEVVDRGWKLYSVDGSYIVDRERK